MKINFLSLAGALLCGTLLSSCMTYDEYGYYDGGAGYYGGTPVVANVYNDGYYGDYGYYNGYRGYSPGFSNVFLGFGGFGGGYPYYGRHRHYDHDHHHHSHSHVSSRSNSRSRDYATRVSRPSSFRDSSISRSAPRIPNVSTPRSSITRPTGSFSRPSSGSVSRPSRGSVSRPSSSIRSSPPRSSMSRPTPSVRPSSSRGATSASFRSSPAPRSGGSGGRSDTRRSR